MRLVRVVTPFVLLLPFAVSAQVRQEGEERADVAPSNWSIGIAGGMRTELYAGEGNHTRAIPFFGYEGERFYFRGITAGYHLIQNESFMGKDPAPWQWDEPRRKAARARRQRRLCRLESSAGPASQARGTRRASR